MEASQSTQLNQVEIVYSGVFSISYQEGLTSPARSSYRKQSLQANLSSLLIKLSISTKKGEKESNSKPKFWQFPAIYLKDLYPWDLKEYLGY